MPPVSAMPSELPGEPVPDPSAEPDDGQNSRIQNLLVSVRDIASTLHRLSIQLEREVGPTLAGGSASTTGSTSGSSPHQDDDQAELQRLRQENAQLRGALDARVVIEQAKGMLMAGRRCSDQQAFELLVGMSQTEQRKLREIAAEIVAAAAPGAADPARPTPAMVRPGRRIDLVSAARSDAERSANQRG